MLNSAMCVLPVERFDEGEGRLEVVHAVSVLTGTERPPLRHEGDGVDVDGGAAALAVGGDDPPRPVHADAGCSANSRYHPARAEGPFRCPQPLHPPRTRPGASKPP